MNHKKTETIQALELAAKENKFDINVLNLDYDKCSISFLSSILLYIGNQKDVSHFIQTCEILFPENPTDLSEDIIMAVIMIDEENTADAIKQELDAGHCEMSMAGLLFESMYQKALNTSETVFTNCGRLAYNNKYNRGLYQMDIFMSEGIEEAYKIYSDVKHVYNCTHKELADASTMFGHLTPGYMLELTMDDMNIRGQQIIYGYEYANHSAEVLAELISNRDKDLIAYINKRTVEEYDNVSIRHKNCLAVDGGASFDRYTLSNKMPAFWNQESVHTKYNPLLDDKQEIINQCIKEHFEIDYASMDINRATSTEEGLKIAKAHGFEIVWSGDIENSDTKSILMVSKDKDALLYAKADENGTMAYGGCDIYVVTKEENADYRRFSWEQLQQNKEIFGNRYDEDNPYRNFRLRDCHYDYGCFKQYEFLKQVFPVQAEEIPWKAAPVSGLSNMPIPETFKFPMLSHGTQQSLMMLLHTADTTSIIKYHAQELINQLNFVREILPNLPQDIKDIYVLYNKEPYKTMAETLPCFDMFDIKKTIVSVGIALQYLSLPEDEEKKFLSEIKSQIMKHTKSEEDIIYATEQWNRIKEDTDTWDKVLETILPNDYVQESDDEYELNR